ncbi:DMT family transporter [Paenibacillus chitinolyticus]|uniref:DMT family transporter n=1 Tax=Paenibacillus chitinolyticus TaxID=79263 RepID=UPI002DBD28E8|nr:DMT family transporter [Paenibacillus chitinolyticus]MEC0245606.1 DMT family transporter [Paenibacillus chitinolyticus]
MNPIKFGSLVVTATLLMGSSFAVGKMGLAYVSPLLLVGVRFTLAGALMALWVLGTRRRMPQTAAGWGRIALIGLFQTTGVMACIFLSLRTISAGESSLLTFVNPLLVVLLGTLFLGMKYRWSQWTGVGVGFLGVAVTLGFQLDFKTGTLFGLGSAVCWAAATLLVKRWSASFDIWVMTAFQMLAGGLALLILGLLVEKPLFVLNADSLWIILYLAVLGSIVQFAAWYYLLSRGDPGKTSAFLFLAPFFGVLSGWLLLGETVRSYVYGGGLLILAGIFLVNWAPARTGVGSPRFEEDHSA